MVFAALDDSGAPRRLRFLDVDELGRLGMLDNALKEALEKAAKLEEELEDVAVLELEDAAMLELEGTAVLEELEDAVVFDEELGEE